MLYRKIIRPIVLKLNLEKAHTFLLALLKVLSNTPISNLLLKLLYKRKFSNLKPEALGITFPNPIGLAAGLDRNGQFCDILTDMGFGFIEVGPITPEPENGSKMHSDGLMAAISNLKQRHPGAIVAANLACNASTPDDEIVKQLGKSFSLIYDFVDFIVINTTGSDERRRSSLEDPEILSEVMDTLLDIRMSMDTSKPVLLKLSPDITREEVNSILSYSMRSGIDGIVAGDIDKDDDEQFGANLEFVKYIQDYTKGRLEIIGCGNIMTPENAQEMIEAGASLVELYTGVLYEGPVLVRKTLKYLDNIKIQK